jgi:hypothetical protein
MAEIATKTEPVSLFQYNNPLDQSLFNIVAFGLSLLNEMALHACIYHLIDLSECNGSSSWSFSNVVALRASRF